MQTDYYYIYLYGSLKHVDSTLDSVMTYMRLNPDHIFFLKHYDQIEEMGGIGLMYGMELKLDTFKNWQECSKFMDSKPLPGFRDLPVTKRKRLPPLVISNYRLPNIVGI